MAIKGRKSKPTALRELEGNRGHRPIPKTVKPTKVLPDPPAWMDGIAKGEWKLTAKELYGVGLLTATDKSALEAYCQYCLATLPIHPGGSGSDFFGPTGL